MKRKAYLLKYNYISHCQGTEDKGIDYALVYAPDDASFNNIRSRLFNKKNEEYNHEIDVESVENMTID
jgi:hypothetical protein